MVASTRLGLLREGQELSRFELAQRVGVSERTVRRWEKGETGIPRGNWDRLSEIFGVSVAHLLGLDDNGTDGGSRKAA